MNFEMKAKNKETQTQHKQLFSYLLNRLEVASRRSCQSQDSKIAIVSN